MRKVGLEIETVKAQIASYKGKTVKMLINRGRKKILRVVADVIDIYPSVFTVRLLEAKSVELLSFSYSDVLCGDVKLYLVS